MTAKIHYLFGGSRMKLISCCSGAVEACKPYADMPAGPAAERGTRIHEHMESALASGRTDLYTTGGSEAKEANIGILAAREITQLAKSHGYEPHELMVEQQFEMPFCDQAGGTPDVAAARPFADLLVFDLKTGNTPVDVEENMQLLFYAWGVYQRLDDFTRMSIGDVHLYIIQPEAEPPHKVHTKKWSIPAARLSEYGSQIESLIREAQANPTARTPGNHCAEQWCQARTECPAYHAWMNEQTNNAFSTLINGGEAAPAKGERLAKQLLALPALRSFIKLVEAEAEASLMKDPESVPGFAITDSYGNRVWTDTKAVASLAKKVGIKADEYQPRSLVSPAAFERLLSAKGFDKDMVNGLTERPYTGVKVVLATKANKGFAEFILAQTAPTPATTGVN